MAHRFLANLDRPRLRFYRRQDKIFQGLLRCRRQPTRHQMTLAPKIKYVWLVWFTITGLLVGSVLSVWSKSCACGYQTPDGLFVSVALAVTAWIAFFLPHPRSYLVRIVIDTWVILSTALLAKHLADVLWLSPHAPFGLW